jgi:hypothetical protein
VVLVKQEVLETELLGNLYFADLLSVQIDMSDAVAEICGRPDRKSHVALIAGIESSIGSLWL